MRGAIPGSVATLTISIASILICCGESTDSPASDESGTPTAFAITCVDDPSTIPRRAARCGFDITSECSALDGDEFFVTPDDLGSDGDGTCDESEIEVETTTGQLGHRVVRLFRKGRRRGRKPWVCTATVAHPPEASTSTTVRRLTVWPPNHRWIKIPLAACAGQPTACADTTYRVVRVTVDEPADGRGDGRSRPDVEIGCGRLRVRAERQGRGDGRIYRVDLQTTGPFGGTDSAQCEVAVPRNRGQPAQWSGESEQFGGPETCTSTSTGGL